MLYMYTVVSWGTTCMHGNCFCAQLLHLCPILWDLWIVAHQSSLCMELSQQEYRGVGSHLLLQGIFLTRDRTPHLLHCRQILKPWATGEPMEQSGYQLEERTFVLSSQDERKWNYAKTGLNGISTNPNSHFLWAHWEDQPQCLILFLEMISGTLEANNAV